MTQDSIQLDTERLTIRQFCRADLDDLHRLLSDPDVMKYYPAALSREESAKWLEDILNDYATNSFGFLCVRLKEGGTFVGQVGVMLHRDFHGEERNFLAYVIHKRFWGNGYATEAAAAILDHAISRFKLDRITALIRPDNTPSIRLARKLGMWYQSAVDHWGCEHHLYLLVP